MPGWKTYARILAPVSREPTEGDGIRKKLTNTKKRNRVIHIVFFGYEIMIASSGKPVISKDLLMVPANRVPCKIANNFP